MVSNSGDINSVFLSCVCSKRIRQIMIQSPFTPAWHELGSDASYLKVTHSYSQSVRDHYLYIAHLVHYVCRIILDSKQLRLICLDSHIADQTL